MARASEKGSGEPRVAVCLYDFALWFMQRTNRFPKNLRVTLGDQIDRQMLLLLGLVQRASVASHKVALLQELNQELNVLRTLTRLSVDLQGLRGRQYEHAARQIDEIGRQIGGWLKQQEARGRSREGAPLREGERTREPVARDCGVPPG